MREVKRERSNGSEGRERWGGKEISERWAETEGMKGGSACWMACL